MRQVTATEKYLAVLEGKMAKKEFVRQMRQSYPMYISNFDGFDSTVQILKTRKMLFEASQKAFSGVKVYDDRPALTYSLDALDRGIRYELQGAGIDPATDKVSPENLQQATKKAKDNLEKDANHYLNLLSGESSKVDKNDKMKEIKRGAQDKDTFNDMKKADLKENVDINSARENIVKVASEIRAKYSEIPGFNVILKDFLQTHQDDIKAGLVTDPIGEFDDYIELNYDRLDEKEENRPHQSDDEFLNHIQNLHQANQKRLKKKKYPKRTDVSEEYKAAYDSLIEAIKELNTNGDEIGAAQDAMEFIGQHYGIDFEFGRGPSRMAEKKGKDLDGDGDIDSDDYMIAKDKAIKKAMGKKVDEAAKVKKLRKLTVGGKTYEIGDFDPNDDGRIIAIEKYPNGYNIIGGVYSDYGDGDEPKERYNYAIDLNGQEMDEEDLEGLYEKAMGKKSEQIKEAIKNIIKKTLSEGILNEAATNELARLADDYAEFQGMKQSIIALQDIVTDIESFYDKTRDKIQKVYDSIGEIRNEEGLKVGGFLAPTIESAFNKDLRPAVKRGFTSGLETPKVKTISRADVDRVNAGGELEEEPKQTVFAPISESKNKK